LNRTNALKQEATKQGKPLNFLIFNPTNILYFSNFSGATALLIPEEGEKILYVSGVNYEQAKEETKDLTVELLKRGENLMEKISRQIPSQKFSVDSLPIESWRALAKAVGGEEKLESANNLIQDLRKIKDKKEIELIRKACKLSDIGIKAAAQTIRPGVKEKEVAAKIEYAMRMAGSDGVAFETIVASGYCCAYPHGTFLEKVIQEGDFVVVDLGAIYKNYRSAITRTFIVCTA
jgi:Xaa-Pro dipeptidase